MQAWVFITLFAVALGAIKVDSVNSYRDKLKVKYTSENCRPGYTLNREKIKCYKLFTGAKLWIDALNTCKNEGAKLATPTSSNDAWYLSSELRKHDLEVSDAEYYYFQYIFVGIARKGENDWREIYSGRPLNSDIHWAEGEPNNAEGKERCLAVDRYGELNDYYCDKPAVFFCEYDLEEPIIYYIENLVSEYMRRFK